MGAEQCWATRSINSIILLKFWLSCSRDDRRILTETQYRRFAIDKIHGLLRYFLDCEECLDFAVDTP